MIDPQKREELTEQREVRGRVKQERCSDSPLRRRKRLQKWETTRSWLSA